MRNLIFRHVQRGVDDMEMASICQLDLCDQQHVDEYKQIILLLFSDVFHISQKRLTNLIELSGSA